MTLRKKEEEGEGRERTPDGGLPHGGGRRGRGFLRSLGYAGGETRGRGDPPGEPCWDLHGWAHLGRAWPDARTVHPSRPGSWATRNQAPGTVFSRRKA